MPSLSLKYDPVLFCWITSAMTSIQLAYTAIGACISRRYRAKVCMMPFGRFVRISMGVLHHMDFSFCTPFFEFWAHERGWVLLHLTCHCRAALCSVCRYAVLLFFALYFWRAGHLSSWGALLRSMSYMHSYRKFSIWRRSFAPLSFLFASEKAELFWRVNVLYFVGIGRQPQKTWRHRNSPHRKSSHATWPLSNHSDPEATIVMATAIWRNKQQHGR